MSVLNNRIQKLKVNFAADCILRLEIIWALGEPERFCSLQERESNPLLRLQDTVADTVEPLKRETSKAAQRIPDPRELVPSTVPKVTVRGVAALTNDLGLSSAALLTSRLSIIHLRRLKPSRNCLQV